ncbi:hypothetical protein D3D65_23140 [Salmonella enterica]|nr:hypothetical protein [Salmonella enterica]
MAVVVVILTLINRTDKRAAQYLYVLFFIPLIMIVLCLLLLNGAKMPIVVQFSPFFNDLDAAKLRTVIVITLKRLFAI